MADSNTAFVALACAQGALTLVLVGATVYYARKTKDIASASREQADASVKMAEEVHKQGLDADRPYLLIEVPSLETVTWFKNPKDAYADPNSDYPKSITCRIYNAGRGPAKELVATLLQPVLACPESRKEVLRPGESWDLRLEGSESLTYIHLGFSPEEPLGLENWMKRRRIDSPSGYDCGLVVCCTDIHDRAWGTYLRLAPIRMTDEVSRVVLDRKLITTEHRIVRLEQCNDS